MMKDQKQNQEATSGFNRRAFLRGSGAAAAATALATGNGLAEAQAQKTKSKAKAKVVAKSEVVKIDIMVNGKKQSVTAEPRTTLLDVLRYQLNLTGAKPVSIDGSSGASSVWVDNKVVSANTVLALDCANKKVRTVEDLGGAKPDAVPMAFVHQDASQCGFCTPGFVVAMRAFLDKHPKATEEEIRAGLNGNLCRCGTYHNVVQAALEVVKGGANG